MRIYRTFFKIFLGWHVDVFIHNDATECCIAPFTLHGGRSMSRQIKKWRSKTKAGTIFLIFTLLVSGLSWATYTAAAAIVGDPVLGADDPILGSKHDFTGLNERAGVVAMAGVAFSDYGYSCVYCHIPPEEAGAVPADFGGIDGWNRYVPALSNYHYTTALTWTAKPAGPTPSVCSVCPATTAPWQ